MTEFIGAVFWAIGSSFSAISVAAIPLIYLAYALPIKTDIVDPNEMALMAVSFAAVFFSFGLVGLLMLAMGEELQR
jgi:hypothetical protein